MKVMGGIDYSMTSPCVCVHIGDEWSVDNCVFLFVTSQKSKATTFLNGRIEGLLMDDYTHDTQRFSFLAKYMLAFLDKYYCTDVALEGYSMGSTKGLIFNIAENTGLLKYKMYHDNVEFYPIAPTSVKKFASGKGNSKKDAMYEAWLKETDIDLQYIISPKSKKIGNPVSDIVDAYYICKMNFEGKFKG